jgi:protein-S-isoprenylcysteine O-methyltransferase Ste14
MTTTGPFFAGHPVAMALFGGAVVVWAALELRQALRRRAEATDMDRGSAVLVRLCLAAGIALAALALRVTATAFPSTAAGVGLSLGVLWAGIGLRWWSFLTLGRYFTVTVMTSAHQPVIAAGPYRVLRHPSYAGLLLALGGLGLGFRNWLSLAALLLLPLLGLLNRIRVEEAALSATLGSAYATFADHRKRLIPFVW